MDVKRIYGAIALPFGSPVFTRSQSGAGPAAIIQRVYSTNRILAFSRPFCLVDLGRS
jgi:hypothetical protein